MNVEVKKDASQGSKVVVEVNVADIVKYICITSVIIASIVFASKVLSKVLDNKLNDLL